MKNCKKCEHSFKYKQMITDYYDCHKKSQMVAFPMFKAMICKFFKRRKANGNVSY